MGRTLEKPARTGSTLFELLVVLVLMTTTVGSLLALGERGARLFETGVTRSELEGRARRAADALAREFASASSSSIEALPESPLWQEQIDFTQAAAIRPGDGRITWSTDRLEFRYEAPETGNGLDDDGDGLVDEGLLALVQDRGGADERTVVLVHGVREYLEGELPNGLDDNGNGLVDERGVAFERVGGDLRLHLTLEAIDRDGRLVTRTMETTTWSRN